MKLTKTQQALQNPSKVISAWGYVTAFIRFEDGTFITSDFRNKNFYELAKKCHNAIYNIGRQKTYKTLSEIQKNYEISPLTISELITL